MSDIDADSTMHSSPSLPNDDDEMFPDETLPHNTAPGPSTPHHPAAAASAELSPPNSQSQQSRDPTALTLNANGKRPLSAAQTAAAASNVAGGSGSGSVAGNQDPESGYQWKAQEEQPGWDWKNPRAREEEVRALDSIVDKGLQIKLRYGDPLDASVASRGKK